MKKLFFVLLLALIGTAQAGEMQSVEAHMLTCDELHEAIDDAGEDGIMVHAYTRFGQMNLHTASLSHMTKLCRADDKNFGGERRYIPAKDRYCRVWVCGSDDNS